MKKINNPILFSSDTYSLNIVEVIHLPLVERFYIDNGYRVKCVRLDRVYSFTLNGKIIAAARLIPQQSDVYLLRNLCVATDYRRQGVGSLFLSELVPQFKPKDCYCFISATLQHFYEAAGFECMAVDQLPIDQMPADIRDMHVRQRKRKRGWVLMGVINS